MEDEVQLISDGDGLAVIGEPTAVELFLNSEGLASSAVDIPRLSTALSTGSAAATSGSAVAASGRWMKLTKESAEVVKKHKLMQDPETKTYYAKALAKGDSKIFRNLRFEGGLVKSVTNPAILSGVAGVMAQQAMQQAMDEITDYLAAIDAKVDDVLRAQKDAVLADMIGVDFVIEEAMTIRGQVGRVSEVTWSKIQANSTTIARTQAYALRQLDALAEKLERQSSFSDMTDAAKQAEERAAEWLAVLAHCFKLQDAIAVLELDRVLETSPDELNDHRLGLKTARENRLELIARSTEHLLDRMAVAANTANSKVLFNPIHAPAVVRASNHVSRDVVEFQTRLGLETAQSSTESRRWIEAAAEVRDKALETGADGIDAAKRFGDTARERARSVSATVSRRRARWPRHRGDDETQLYEE